MGPLRSKEISYILENNKKCLYTIQKTVCLFENWWAHFWRLQQHGKWHRNELILEKNRMENNNEKQTFCAQLKSFLM